MWRFWISFAGYGLAGGLSASDPGPSAAAASGGQPDDCRDVASGRRSACCSRGISPGCICAATPGAGWDAAAGGRSAQDTPHADTILVLKSTSAGSGLGQVGVVKKVVGPR